MATLAVPLLQAADPTFDGFEGLSFALLVLAALAGGVFVLATAWRWLASRPRLPAPGPPTTELGPESPAIANLLVNRWKVTRAALPATIVDLAARRILGLEDYAGGRHVVRIRSNQPEGESLTRYEAQLLTLVQKRATGGSCPVEALDPGGEAESKRFWDRFSGSVRDEAKKRGLARGRWTHQDRLYVGIPLAVCLALLASAFSLAHLGKTAEPTDDDLGPMAWYIGAGIAWVAVLAYFSRSSALRDTPEGRAAAARWLGVRRHLQASTAFGEAPPGAVAIWERYLAFAAAFGIAHTTARALPFEDDDPNTGWSRYRGQWQQIRIDYPKRWGFGQHPAKIFLQGLGITAAAGFVGFLILPGIVRFVWDVAPDVLEAEGQVGLSRRAEIGLIVGLTVFAGGAGVVLLYHLLNGVMRLALGASDLGRSVTRRGEVVNVHLGRVAIDDGEEDETNAWFPPPGGPALRRGDVIEVVRSPRLWHVQRVRVLRDAQAAQVEGLPAVAPEEGDELAGVISGLAGGPLAGALAGRFDGMAVRSYSDGHDGGVTVRYHANGSPVPAFFELLANLPGAAVTTPSGETATWVGDHVLTVPTANGVVSVDVELAGLDDEARRALAEKIAARAAADPSLAAPPDNPAPPA
ncbi:MAG: DUF2207 domain-containing protein [Dehalococcoidia bacterium]|nr:DUF2207 domain-containing protein [Dehalococcoidia bacterium]